MIDRAALRSAFSPSANLRRLFSPPAAHLGPLDGLRALSILWVVFFHAGWYAAPVVPLPVYAQLLGDPWLLPLWRGDFGVDVFFVLSGFLIAGLLVDARARGELRLGRFYLRRLLRLWPALAVAAALEVVTMRDNSSMIWANLLYVSNFVPVLQVAMGWTWSLAIEEQFYLVCPWLVMAVAERSARVRVLVLAALVAAIVTTAAVVVVRGGFFAIDADVVVNRDFLRWARGFDALYAKPWMRAGPLLFGVAAAYVYREPRLMAALATHRFAAACGFVAALVAAGLATSWQLVERAPRAVEVAYLASYRTVFGAAVAYIVLFSLSKHPLGVRLGGLLSSRALYPIAQLAYGAYLLNPTLATLVHRATAPLVWRGVIGPMPLFLPLDTLATFAGALVLYLAVERPFMELRPRP